MTDQPKALRGFAAIKAKDPDRQLEMSRKGGRSIPADKRSFSVNRDLAVEAGRKGGSASPGNRDDG